MNEVFKEGYQAIKLIFMLRLIMIPFGITNYTIACVTSVQFWKYFVGSTAIVFKCMIHTFIGASLYDISIKKNNSDTHWDNILIIAEIVLTVLLTILMSYYAKKTVDKKIQELQ